jgi:hypothetical protein
VVETVLFFLIPIGELLYHFLSPRKLNLEFDFPQIKSEQNLVRSSFEKDFKFLNLSLEGFIN